jgi:CO dehydrogenase nickel-insertion accessory protein CooC1
VLNKVPDEASERYLREKLARHSIAPVAVIHEDRRISSAWMRGEPLESKTISDSLAGLVAALESAASGESQERRKALRSR